MRRDRGGDRKADERTARKRRRLGVCVAVRVRRLRRRRRGGVGGLTIVLLGLIAARLAQGVTALLVLGELFRRQGPRDDASTTPADIPARGSPESPAVAATAVPHVAPRVNNPSTRTRPSYLPTLSSGEIQFARSLAFLIRNRGGRHGPAAAMHWRNLDASSLPLAVYLRDVDDRGQWRGLEREVAAYRLAGLRPVLAQDRILGQERLLKLIQLAPRWKARGAAMVAGDGDGEPEQPRPELVPGTISMAGGVRPKRWHSNAGKRPIPTSRGISASRS